MPHDTVQGSASLFRTSNDAAPLPLAAALFNRSPGPDGVPSDSDNMMGSYRFFGALELSVLCRYTTKLSVFVPFLCIEGINIALTKIDFINMVHLGYSLSIA